MAELLILAKNGYTNPDAEKDRRGCYKKGDVVVVAEDAHEWGTKEGPPNFIIVQVSGVTVAQVDAYREAWNFEIDFNIVNQNLPQDGFRIELFNTLPGALNQAAITRAQVENFIEDWGGTVQSVGSNFVRFDIRIYDALTSFAFWGRTDIPFTEVSYTQGTGVHRISGDYNLIPNITSVKAAKSVTKRGGTIISNSGGVIVFDMDRIIARNSFQDDLRNQARKIFKRRRFSFSSADVDSVIAAGGTVSRTPAQVQAALIDATL